MSMSMIFISSSKESVTLKEIPPRGPEKVKLHIAISCSYIRQSYEITLVFSF